MIKAIIFDCFGVLSTEGWEPFYQKHFGDKPVLLEQARDLIRQLNKGSLSYDSFIPKITKLAGVPRSEFLAQFHENVPNQLLFNYIKNVLKTKYKIGLLSNAGANWLDKIFAPEQLGLIDEYVLSYSVKFIKPQPEIYDIITKKLGVKNNQCIMVDDRQKQVDGAKELGLKAILYQDFEQMKDELGKILATDS